MKEKFIHAWNAVKAFFAVIASAFQKAFAYIRNMMRYAVPFLLVIILLLVMYTHSESRRHALELQTQETSVITEHYVAEELKSIGQLYTGEYTYTLERSFSDSRELFTLNVPFTEKSLFISYSGKVMVGYNVADIQPSIVGNVIHLTLPEPIIENVITKEVVKDEDNNVFNPIHAEDYELLREDVLDNGLKNATERGIHQEADTTLRSILTDHFEILGYQVAFV